jgi:hypothetical protein
MDPRDHVERKSRSPSYYCVRRALDEAGTVIAEAVVDPMP